jgi:hypothetical protein
VAAKQARIGPCFGIDRAACSLGFRASQTWESSKSNNTCIMNSLHCTFCSCKNTYLHEKPASTWYTILYAPSDQNTKSILMLNLMFPHTWWRGTVEHQSAVAGSAVQESYMADEHDGAAFQAASWSVHSGNI